MQGKTHAAHIFSWSLYNVIATHSKLRVKMSDEQLKLFCKEMNQASNLRIKTVNGNIQEDEFRDYQISHAFVTKSTLKG